MLGAAALVLGQRIVVVEDVDHAARSRRAWPGEARASSASSVDLERPVIGEHRHAQASGEPRIEGAAAGEVAIGQGIGALAGDQRRAALDQDREPRLGQEANEEEGPAGRGRGRRGRCRPRDRPGCRGRSGRPGSARASRAGSGPRCRARCRSAAGEGTEGPADASRQSRGSRSGSRRAAPCGCGRSAASGPGAASRDSCGTGSRHGDAGCPPPARCRERASTRAVLPLPSTPQTAIMRSRQGCWPEAPSRHDPSGSRPRRVAGGPAGLLQRLEHGVGQASRARRRRPRPRLVPPRPRPAHPARRAAGR